MTARPRIGLFFFLASMMFSSLVYANDEYEEGQHFGIGPSVLYDGQLQVGLEISTFDIPTLENMRDKGLWSLVSWWVAAGVNWKTQSNVAKFYAEAGAWFLLSVGLGLGTDTGAARPEAHGFIGLPLPIGLLFPEDDLYIGRTYLTPFYRPGRAIESGSEWFHEFGVGFKYDMF